MWLGTKDGPSHFHYDEDILLSFFVFYIYIYKITNAVLYWCVYTYRGNHEASSKNTNLFTLA